MPSEEREKRERREREAREATLRRALKRQEETNLRLARARAMQKALADEKARDAAERARADAQQKAQDELDRRRRKN